MYPLKGHKDYKKCNRKLTKALYGLKQSGRTWNNESNEKLTKLKFNRLISGPCIYIKRNDEN